MAVDVVVTGIGLRSAFGALNQTWEAIIKGQTAIALSQPFRELPPSPLAMWGSQPGHLQPLIQPTVADTLADAGLEFPLTDCGVVVGSSRGYQADLEGLARDTTDGCLGLFPGFLHGQLAATVAGIIGSEGPVLNPMAACATGLWAIAQGFELIKTQQCQRVIVGALEAPITPLSLIGFAKMGALASESAYPFCRRRDGLALGEGAALLVLESAELAHRRHGKIYGSILGFGVTVDACYHNKPDAEGKSAIAAIQRSLNHSHLHPTDIDYIHAHGTATILNDKHEAFIINQLFPNGVAVSSTKGATGHTLGASGALGVAFCLKALKQQLLPPCVGLQDLEFPLDVVTTPRSTVVNNVLCLGFGFGGQNVAIALGANPHKN